MKISKNMSTYWPRCRQPQNGRLPYKLGRMSRLPKRSTRIHCSSTVSASGRDSSTNFLLLVDTTTDKSTENVDLVQSAREKDTSESSSLAPIENDGTDLPNNLREWYIGGH